MTASCDVIVIGLGAMGSAAAYHLAKRGCKVLGVDRFTPPHSLGSSHGQTRIIREAYFEHPAYVPIVQRAYELWDELAKESRRILFLQTGGLMIGPPEGIVAGGARRSAELHRLNHEILAASEVARRFPALRPAEEMIAVWEPRAGILYPEECISAHLALARQHGANLKFQEKVFRWEANEKEVRVHTDHGVYTANRLVLSAGSWLQSLLPALNLSLVVERQVLFWFAPKTPAQFVPARCPIHLWEHSPGKIFYGFPDLGHGVKLAGHHEGEVSDPDSLRREVEPAEVEGMRRLVQPFLPGLGDQLLEATTCLYTNTGDGHFLIDHHPAHPRVLIASPCSGHGFKFSCAIGEIIADLVQKGRSRFDLSLFRDRLFPTYHT